MEATLHHPSRTAAGAVCHHCGESCRGNITEGGKTFCCEGCRQVYLLLDANGMCPYYDIEAGPGIRARGRFTDGRYGYLDDPDVTLVQEAIRRMQALDSTATAQALTRTLATTAQPERLLRGILLAAETDGIVALVQAAAPRLEQLMASENPAISELAARLLLKDPSRRTLQHTLLERKEPRLSYALLDSMLEESAGNAEAAARFADDDLYFLRLAAQLHIWKLGADYQPPKAD